MSDAALADVELGYLIETLTKADALRGRTKTSLVYPMHRSEYDRFYYAAAKRHERYMLPVTNAIGVSYPPPIGHEGRVGMWLVGVWVERMET